MAKVTFQPPAKSKANFFKRLLNMMGNLGLAAI